MDCTGTNDKLLSDGEFRLSGTKSPKLNIYNGYCNNIHSQSLWSYIRQTNAAIIKFIISEVQNDEKITLDQSGKVSLNLQYVEDMCFCFRNTL